jgi:hypothetical protein
MEIKKINEDVNKASVLQSYFSYDIIAFVRKLTRQAQLKGEIATRQRRQKLKNMESVVLEAIIRQPRKTEQTKKT